MIRYVIVALFDAVDVGATFDRRRWPAHVTLVSNFVTAASVDELTGAVRRNHRSCAATNAAQRSRAAKRSMSEFVPDTMMRSWLVTMVFASA